MSVTISGSGQIIKQVIQTVKTDIFTGSGSSAWADITGLSVSITPTNAANKILVMFNIGGAASSNDITFQLLRNTTPICIGDAAGSRLRSTLGNAASGGNNGVLGLGSVYLDSPATTSAITYKVQCWSYTTFYINEQGNDSDLSYRTRSASTITVMEVAYA